MCTSSRYGCSESTSSGGSSPGASATASSQQTSRPACIGASSPPSRRHTTTCSTDGDSAQRLVDERLHRHLAPAPQRPVRRHRPPSPRSAEAGPRSRAPRTPRRSAPAPRRDARTRATRWRPPATSAGRSRPRSPASTPSAASASARRVTSCESSRYDSDAPLAVLALPDRGGCVRPLAAAHRWTQFHARFRRPPTNQVAHSGPRDSSTTASHGRENSSPMSSIAAGQKRSGSSAEKRTSEA